jgi:putative CocE/NonD family hydrolase
VLGATVLYHGPYTQASVLARADQRTFVSAVLSAPLRIQGTLTASLDVSTTGADTDFMVRVTDVDGAGVHTLIGEGARRLKLRNAYNAAATVVANQQYTVELAFLNDLAWTIPAGHRLGVIVTSSNYPLFDRNPNNGENFFAASPAPVAVTNSVYTGSSRLVLQVAP